MSNQNNSLPMSVEQGIRTMQIIVAALAMGALMFGVVINVFIGPAEGEAGIMTNAGLMLGLAALVSHRIIASFVLAAGIKDLPEDEDAARLQLLGARQASTIVACAIVESAMFLNLVVYGFMEGQPISMAMATLLWFAIVIKFPFAAAINDWLDREIRTLREERELKGGA